MGQTNGRDSHVEVDKGMRMETTCLEHWRVSEFATTIMTERCLGS